MPLVQNLLLAMMNPHKFNYCIARPWEDLKDSLCVYTIHNNSTFFGDDEDAQETLDYVNRTSEADETYEIYEIVKK